MDVFPQDLPGLAWSILRVPRFATRIQTAISGRELRAADYPYPIWTWTLTYDFLRDGNSTAFGGVPSLGTGHQELRELMGFYARQQGAFNTFLYNDTSDNIAVNQGIGVGDGSNRTFQLQRTLAAPSYGGLFTEPVTQPSTIQGVWVNGTPIGYTQGGYGQITLAAAPESGQIVTASFTYYWPVRFTEDTAEFENFMNGLWMLKRLSFESVLLP